MKTWIKLSLKNKLIIFIASNLFLLLFTQLFYYSKFYSLTKERAEAVSVSNIKQVSDQINTAALNVSKKAYQISYNRYVQEYLETTDSKKRSLELSPIVSDLLDSMKLLDNDIYDIKLTDSKGRFMSVSYDYEYSIYEELDRLYEQGGLKNSEIFIMPLKNNEANTCYYAYVFPVFSAVNSADMFNRSGKCTFLMKASHIDDIINNVYLPNNSIMLVLDEENKIIASSAGEGEYTRDNYFFAELSGENISKIRYNNQESILVYSENSGKKIISIIPVKELTSDLGPIRSFAVITGIIMIIIQLFAGIIIFFDINTPISKIVNFIESADKKNFKGRLEVEVYGEIGIIADNINRLLDKIEVKNKKIFKTQEWLYEAELGRKQAQLSAIESQVNPHFLYNTLNCISGIGIENDIPEIVDITSSMASMFRYMINEVEYAPIRDEITCIKNYSRILAIRYQNKIKFEISVDREIMDIKTIKMILQPIVENSIHHGLEQSEKGGIVKISGKLSENRIIFTVSDDGKGMTAEELNAVISNMNDKNYKAVYDTMNKKGMGLRNTNRRIKMVFGDKYGVYIESRPDFGTKVTIIIPA